MTRVLWALVLTLMPLGGVTRSQEPATATGLIVGRVVDAASGAPVASAEVRLDVAGRPPVMGVLTGADGYFVMAVMPVQADGTFSGEVAPGVYRASIAEGRAAGPVWTAESMLASGRDILDEAVVVRTGQPLTNMSVTLVDQPTEISGVLRHPDGTPEPGVMMVAFAADERFWTHGSRRVRSALPDPEGRYRITGLPPGDYFLGAVGRFDTSNGIGTEVLAALVAASTRVTLARGQQVEQDFTVGGGR